MTPAMWAAIAALLGPILLFITYLMSRKQTSRTFMSDLMTAQINSALSTTETMRTLLEPLESEISDLRQEIVILRNHITVLEAKIVELGHQPPEFPYSSY
jgi:polyhydroxyalkanoate synthesis regulator phasin